jgi:ankyrin repeat protein
MTLDIDSPRAFEGSGQWLLRNAEFQSWKSSDNWEDDKLLWLTGNPGCGKSTLSKFVVEHLRETASAALRPDIIVSFFSHEVDPKVKERDPSNLLFSTLLYQVLAQAPSAPFELPKRAESISSQSTNNLQCYLEEALAATRRFANVFIIIDGLDEFGSNKIKDCLDHLHRLSNYLYRLRQSSTLSSSRHRVRVLFSSRPEAVIEKAFRGLAFRLEEHTTQDIGMYVDAKLRTLKFDLGICDHASELEQEIRVVVIQKAEGLFLWAYLVFDSLLPIFMRTGEKNLHLRKVHEKLSGLPSSLNELYERVLNGIRGSEHRGLAFMTLKWVTFAARPLSLDEMRVALEFDMSQANDNRYTYGASPKSKCDIHQRLISSCWGLITTSSSSRLVRFAHASVREFLVTRDFWGIMDDSEASSSAKGLANDSLARTCLHYLSSIGSQETLSPPEDTSSLTGKYPFLTYATLYWAHHVKLADTQGIPQAYLLDYFEWHATDRLSRWLQLHRGLKEGRTPKLKRTTLLHVASSYGLLNVVKSILHNASSADVFNQMDDFGFTPIHMAARSGNIEVVRLLIDRGLDPGVPSDSGYTALMFAAYHGHESVVQIILQHLVDRPYVHYRSTAWVLTSALILASVAGRKRLVAKLLSAVPSTSYDTAPIHNALAHAVMHGHTEVARVLLQSGIGPNIKDSHYGQSVLSLAVAHGNESTVQVLLDHGADPNIEDANSGHTPLSHAIRRGYAKIAAKLIEKGASIDHVAHSKKIKADSWAGRVLNNLASLTLGPPSHTLSGSVQSSTQGVAGSPPTVQNSEQEGGSGGKRGREDEETPNEDNEDSKEGGHSRDSKPPAKRVAQDKNTACPYYIRYPNKYNCQAFSNVARLKYAKCFQHKLRSVLIAK